MYKKSWKCREEICCYHRGFSTKRRGYYGFNPLARVASAKVWVKNRKKNYGQYSVPSGAKCCASSCHECTHAGEVERTTKTTLRWCCDDVVIVSGYRYSYLFPTALTVDFHRLAKEYGYRHSIATRRRRFVYTMYIQNCTAVSAPPYIFTAFRVSTWSCYC